MANSEFGIRFHDLKYVEVAYFPYSLEFITNLREKYQKVLTNFNII